MNSKTIMWIVVVLVLVVLGIYWYMPSSNTYNTPTVTPPVTDNTAGTQPVPPTVTPPTTSQPAITPPAAGQTASLAISIKNFAFSPANVTVKAGTVVTWTNNDTTQHTVTSDVGGVLKSATLNPGMTYSFITSQKGTFSYHCSIHPMMKGTLTID